MTPWRNVSTLFAAIACLPLLLSGSTVAQAVDEAIVIVPESMRSQGEEAFVTVRDDLLGSRHFQLEQIKLGQKNTASVAVTAASGRVFTLQAKGSGLALMRLTDVRNRHARYFKIYVEHPDVEQFKRKPTSQRKGQRYELHFGTPPYQARLENDHRPTVDPRTYTVRIPQCSAPEQCPRYLRVQDALGIVIYKSLLPDLPLVSDLHQRRLDCEDAWARNKLRHKKRALRHCMEDASFASAN